MYKAILKCLISSQSLENFSAMTTLIAQHLESFMRQIHDTEFPNSVEATEQLLIEQSAEYNRLKVRGFWSHIVEWCFNLFSLIFIQEEILSVGRQGEELLAEIRRKTEMCVDRVGNISSIERFVIFQLKAFISSFIDFPLM